jgi:hypothetical protein
VDGEKCDLEDQDREIIEKVAVLLGLQPEELRHVCLSRQINVRGTVTEIPLKLPEVTSLYSIFVFKTYWFIFSKPLTFCYHLVGKIIKVDHATDSAWLIMDVYRIVVPRQLHQF